MDEGKGKSVKLEELMKEVFPDGAAMWQQHPAPSNSAGRPITSQLSMDSNAYIRNLVQTSPGCSSPSIMAKHQDPFGVLQHTAQSTLQMPAFHQSQNLTLNDKLILPGNQTQPMLLHGSSPQAEFPSSIDWINEAYHNIRNIKETYLTDLHMFHRRLLEVRRQPTNVEAASKADKSRISIEKMINFLNISATDLLNLGREKTFLFMNSMLRSLQHFRTGSSLHAKQTHPVEASFGNSEGVHHQIQSLRQQSGALTLPQTSFNSFKIGSSVGLHKVDPLSMVNNASQYSLMRPAQQWAPQGSVGPSPHKGFGDQIALHRLLHNPVGVPQHNNSVVSSRNIFNSLDYSMAQTTTPITMPPLQNNQQDSGLKRQKMKQQMMSEKNKQQMLQKLNEDAKMRFLMGGSSHRWSPVLPLSPSPYAISPQNSQQSSSQFELKDLSTKFSKPSVLPSPLTPPTSNPADSVSSPLIEESSKIVKSSGTSPQLLLPEKTPQRLTKSCLHRESTGDKQSPQDKGDASKHLVEVVKKISSRALTATLRDITAVTTLTDRITGYFLDGDSTKVICHGLADEINSEISSFKYGTVFESRMKRRLDAEVLNDSTTEMEFYTSGRMKRLKKETNNLLLLKEIKEINKKLIEVVVEVMAVEDVFREEFGGTLIRCSYIPIGLSSNINASSTSKLMFPNLLLDLIVCADYPNSSPAVMENTPSDFRDGEDEKYLWMKAKSSFSLSIKKLSEPISVKEMAEIWDVCAREVFHDFAEQIGEGTFSSIYGKWENCAVAG